MSRLAFIADIHVGNPSAFGGPITCGINNRGRQVLDALEAAVKAVEKYDALVICGDLFDTSAPSPQMVAEVQRILSHAPPTYILLGNHDMVSNASGDHALGPLEPIAHVLIAQRPEVDEIGNTLLLSVPFQPGDAREWFPDAVAQLAKEADTYGDRKRVLAFHLGIIDSTTPAFLAHAHDAIELEVVQRLMKQHGIDAAFCGNWHNGRNWGRVVQCGALAPTGWDNAGWDYGQVRTLDTVTGLISSIPVPGPRFITATTAEEARKASLEATRRKCPLYLQLKGEAATEEQLEEVRAWGVQARAVADTADAREATKKAAVAARKATTLQEALAKYVQQMPLAEGVSREAVASMAARYLTRGEA